MKVCATTIRRRGVIPRRRGSATYRRFPNLLGPKARKNPDPKTNPRPGVSFEADLEVCATTGRRRGGTSRRRGSAL
ncbi:MAG: hypothetical protein LBC18_10305 [Opitutaceae bacterium]|nr:hypothetical protein [Opitutaceae bacterium]